MSTNIPSDQATSTALGTGKQQSSPSLPSRQFFESSMNRHRTLSTNNLLPLSDPEAIIRAANTARRHLTQPIRPAQTTSMTDSPGNTTPNIPHLPDDSYRTWFRLVIKAQHVALVQNEYNRRAAWEVAEANEIRIAASKNLFLPWR
ncbi:hypothetical protein KEM48_006698 [Puccinia striiformis f. sp. tritici PST-130]|nr:hypothetical protein Pst134EB_003812 [Puccinia striiformis f. sp. tritici]KAI9618415.1 hypothetical protein KEM48_006698 [Puccinia striiformis f. sp. tritici PST-130]